jgi:hypothetical protein
MLDTTPTASQQVRLLMAAAVLGGPARPYFVEVAWCRVRRGP